LKTTYVNHITRQEKKASSFMLDVGFHSSWKEQNSGIREQERERQIDLISGAQAAVFVISSFSPHFYTRLE
jgi:hypothetical protein